MPLIETSDGVRLFHDIAGDGPPILFAHEFGGDWRSWDRQVQALSGRFRCIRFCARGFQPSEVPAKTASYGQVRATQDLAELADSLALDRFHLVGCSMGSFTSLIYALAQGDRLASLTLVGCSSGPADQQECRRYRAELQRQIDLLDAEGGDGAVAWLEADSAYRRLAAKAPADWAAYKDRLRQQSVVGARHTLSSVHWHRDSLWDHESELSRLAVPTLLIYGEEDHPLVLRTNPDLARHLPKASLVSLPRTGHLVQIEEPAAFLERLVPHLEGAQGQA